MAIITLYEIFDILIMTAFIGFIFKDFFRKPAAIAYDPLSAITRGFDWNNFLFACYVTAPAIIFHEFAHKFVGLSFGLQSTFHAAYGWLALGMVLKLMNFGFIFFVPAYVSIAGLGTHLQFAAISIAGPLMNLAIFIGATLTLKYTKVSHKYAPFLILTKKLNFFLFLFNMLPIRPFDGGNFFFHIWQVLF